MAEKLKEVDIPDLTAMETMKFDMTSNSGKFQMSDEILEMLKSSDVTTITDSTKAMAEYMFEQMTPSIITNITNGLDSGINSINDSVSQLSKAIDAMPPIPEMQGRIAGMKGAVLQMTDTVDKMKTLKEAIPGAFDTAKTNYLQEIENRRSAIEQEFQTTLNNGFKQVYSTVAIASLLAMIVLMLYREERKAKIQ